MDILEKFLRKVSYKFPKGYPDINDAQDMLMLEGMLKEMGIDLREASLSGTATGYSQTYGAFMKYVQDNDKHIVGNTDDIKYKANKNATLLDTDFKPSEEIKKGEEFNILIKNANDLVKKSVSTYALISFNNKKLYIKISDILKPSGKELEKYNPKIEKSDPSIYHPFTPGHPQEKKVVELLIDESDQNWGFKYDDTSYNITYLGDPEWKGQGNPKSDVQVSLNGNPRPDIGSDFQISLKAGNAVFVENWVIPSRALQLFDADVLKKELLDIQTTVNSGKLFKRQSTAKNLAFFISTSPNVYTIDTGTETRGSYKLPDESKYEAYSGDEKFGIESKGRANCFFKGVVPKTIEEFIKQIKPIKGNLDQFADLYIHFRGTNESRGGSLVFQRIEQKDGSVRYEITDRWKSALGL
jgi:hypothetical protein